MAAGSVHRNFASVLDELIEDEAARREWPGARSASLDYLAVTEALHSGRIVISDDAVTAGYREVAETSPAAPQTAPPRPAPSTDPAAIARELGLEGGGPKTDLDLLRRRFAFSNHPDRVEPALRGVAMARMQIANMLIDEAKKRRLAGRPA